MPIAEGRVLGAWVLGGLVANAFLPYPDLLEAAFGGFEILADDRRFRVYRAVRR